MLSFWWTKKIFKNECDEALIETYFKRTIVEAYYRSYQPSHEPPLLAFLITPPNRRTYAPKITVFDQ